MDTEKQKDEIIALKSIFTEEEFSHDEKTPQLCIINIYLSLPDKFNVIHKGGDDDSLKRMNISHLPPLQLFVTLPEDYPSTRPPNFTLHSSWLRKPLLIKLCNKLDEIWQENLHQEVLFAWISFLKNDTLEFLKIEEEVTLPFGKSTKNADLKEKRTRKHANRKRPDSERRAVSNPPSNQSLIQALIDYNEMRRVVEFKRNVYTCKICFADVPGENCTQFLPCLHVFCKECISGYVQVKINDGSVQGITCPQEKCTSEASPGQVKELVNPEMFAKYDSILLSSTLDTMSDIIYCPRRHCQYPVSREGDEKMASCPACQYSFCVFCKMVYHGIEPCKLTNPEKQALLEEYENADDEKRAKIEQRFGRNGKRQLEMLLENSRSEHWITTNSRVCPRCNIAIEKLEGCNKMTCWRCGTYFCYICSDFLNRNTPYSHYNDPSSKCFNKLFLNMIGDEDSDTGEEELDFFD